MRADEYDKAEASFKSALEQAEKSGSKEQIAEATLGLADTYLAEENLDESEDSYMHALDTLGATTNQTSVRSYHGLGRLNFQRKTNALAEKSLKKAYALEQDLDVEDEVETASILADLAELYQATGKESTAKDTYQEALTILEGLPKKEYNLHTRVMEALEKIAKNEDDNETAENYRRRITTLQLHKAKNVMTVLPWVKLKNDAPESDEQN